MATTTTRASNAVRQLRGCIGTLSPKPLVTALGECASLAAFGDRRFRPIRIVDELPKLRAAVLLLANYCRCCTVCEWEIGMHGILIEFEVEGRGYSYALYFLATFLPESNSI